jgi:tetratricopeptide (TPR) repeat protein
MQQEAIFEMISKDGNLSEAEILLNKAIDILPKDLVIQHSFAELALQKAEKSKHKLEVEKYLSESETICKKLISKTQDFPHPFHTLLKIQLFKLKRIIDEQDSPSIERAIKETEKTVSTAKQHFPEQEFILEAESQFNNLLNHRPEAILLLEKAYEINPRSPYLCLRLANLYELNKDSGRAKSTLEKTLQYIPGDKDINFKYSMILLKEEKCDLESIKFYLRRSFTQGDNRYQAQFYFARTLYLLDERAEASKIFDILKSASLPPKVKSFPRGKVRQNGNLIKFKGTIQKIDISYGFIIRDGYSDIIYFYRYESDYESIWDSFYSKPRVNFNLAFNYKGPVAVNIKIENT